ncbi:unnamed protein product [Candidula unifasciata]|uniref:Hexosyltransferase n=1 Tax=Candidula unifasciata TaxID=100452 RepID=A0A8S3YSE3_9EUPU|nr:unnamed protein product [Candidula unifasciata]
MLRKQYFVGTLVFAVIVFLSTYFFDKSLPRRSKSLVHMEINKLYAAESRRDLNTRSQSVLVPEPVGQVIGNHSNLPDNVIWLNSRVDSQQPFLSQNINEILEERAFHQNTSTNKAPEKYIHITLAKYYYLRKITFALAYRDKLSPQEEQAFSHPKPIPWIREHQAPEPKQISSNVCKDGAPFLLIIVLSTPSSRQARMSIRQTWGSVAVSQTWPHIPLNAKVKLLFVVGSQNVAPSLDETMHIERFLYDDLLILDMVEGYDKLTLKMLSALYWIENHCSQIQFVLKADEDSFVNIPFLVDYLIIHRRDLSKSVLGHMYSSPGVWRGGKWSVSYAEYPFVNFPSHASGSSYIIAGDAVSDLLRVSRNFQPVPIEDAFITGILPKAAGITRYHCTAMSILGELHHWNGGLPTICQYYYTRFTLTDLTPEIFDRMWLTAQINYCNTNGYKGLDYIADKSHLKH